MNEDLDSIAESHHREEHSMGIFWIVGDAPLLLNFHKGKRWLSCYGVLKIIESLLRGFGQVCFANNPFSGAVILIALAIHDRYVAYGALLASIGSLLTSKILRQRDDPVVSGLQNYSAVLVGTVIVSLHPIFFSRPMGVYAWIGIFIMGSLSVFVGLGLSSILSKHNLPVYTLPFNIVTSLLFLSIRARYDMLPEQAPLTNSSAPMHECWTVMEGVLKSSGQVYAIEGTIPSILILVGLFINSPMLTLFSFLGGLFSSLTALIFAPHASICSGVWGYNGFLASGSIVFFVKPSILSLVVGIINAVFTSFVQIGLVPVFQANNLPVFTFPFCLSSLLMLALVEGIPELERIQELTYPEEHYLRAVREDKK